jgi:hypothetical protein
MTLQTHQHRLRIAFQHYWTQHKRVYERRQLLQRPWLEDVLHWSPDGQLHGEVAPSGPGRSPSTTSDGWCPGQR